MGGAESLPAGGGTTAGAFSSETTAGVTAGATSASAGAPGGTVSAAPSNAGAAAAGAPPALLGGKALLVTGTIPLVGTDVQFEAAFKARGLEVEIVQEKLATPTQAAGKRVIMLSYGMSSPAFEAEAFTDVPVPIIVTEDNVLTRLKMASAAGYSQKMTKLTFVSDHALAGGNSGDVEVYSPSQEFFWGKPSPAALQIAHLLGQPEKVSYFAYETGALMIGAVAPAKRVQFFHASHSPDPIDRNLYLNEAGLKLLDTTIAWCLE